MRGYNLIVLTSRFGLEKSLRDGHVWRELRYNLAPMDTNWGALGLLLRELHNQIVLRRALRAIQPNLVFVWSMWGLGMALLVTIQRYGFPMLYYVHDNWLASGYYDDPWFCYWRHVPSHSIKRWAKRLIHHVLVRPFLGRIVPVEGKGLEPRHIAFISQYRKQECLEKGWPVAHARVIYNGIELTQFHPRIEPRQDATLRVLFTGRLVPGKGVQTVLEAFGKLSAHSHMPIVLTLAGDGDATSLWQSPCWPRSNSPPIKNEDRLRFLGRVAPELMPQLYREHDVFVFASIEPEGFPLVLLEAMASGLAVVGTTVGGAAEILKDGYNCLTFDPGDVEGLVARLKQLATDPSLRDQIVAGGLETVRTRFAFSDSLDALEELILASVERHSFSDSGVSCPRTFSPCR